MEGHFCFVEPELLDLEKSSDCNLYFYCSSYYHVLYKLVSSWAIMQPIVPQLGRTELTDTVRGHSVPATTHPPRPLPRCDYSIAATNHSPCQLTRRDHSLSVTLGNSQYRTRVEEMRYKSVAKKNVGFVVTGTEWSRAVHCNRLYSTGSPTVSLSTYLDWLCTV